MILSNAKLVLPDRVTPGGVSVQGDTVAAFTDAPGEDLGGRYLVPGFVDIHCHGSGEHWFFDRPADAAARNLHEGTTSLLCSMWRNAGTYGFVRALENVRAAMPSAPNIRGVHMEGPYLDPTLGSEGGKPWPVDEAEYTELIRVGKNLIRTWTFDPAQPGAEGFARAARAAGIRLAVCYSKAKPELLERYLPLGLAIGSHILCGTGAPPPMFGGTKEPGSDVFVLCRDEMTAEVIADSLGGHVRPYFLKLIYRCKGPDGTALVSDCCPGGDTMGSDVNIINGQLYGSRLTLSVAVRNMAKHTGAGIAELCRMASLTPARAVGLDGRYGSIAPGKAADFAVLNEDLRVCGVMLGGAWVRKDF